MQELWQRVQDRCSLAQEALVSYFDGAGLPLSATVVKRLLREERRPREDARQVVEILLRFFVGQRVLYTEDEVEALGAWFGLPAGAALELMPHVEHTNLDVPLNGSTFQRPEAAYGHLLDHLGLKRTPYVALEGPPGSGKTTLACHLGRNPLVGSWYDVVLYARCPHEAGWQAGDETALLEALHEFIWTLDPDRSPASSLAAARSTLRRLLWHRRALFILDDVADVQVLSQLFIREAGNGLLAVVASGADLEDAGLRLQRITLEGWLPEQARQYVGAVLGRGLADDEARAIDALNEWIAGLPLGWAALAELLFYEDRWSELVEELKVAGTETPRVRAVLERLFGRLPAEHQRLLETWGAFASHAPADPPAVAFVAGLGDREAWAGLRSLHQRHLLRYGPAAGRFELHPILHGLARARLERGGRLADLAERHARFYAGRARSLRDEQNSSTWTAAVRRLLLDLPNVRLGQAWAAGHGHPLALDYFLSLAPYLVATLDEEAYAAWGQAALPLVEANPAAFPALDRFAFYGQLLAVDPARRRAYLERALAIAREEMTEQPLVFQVYGLCRLAQFLYGQAGQAVEAGQALVEALSLAAECGYPDLETHVLAEMARFFLLVRDRAGLEAVAGRLPVEPPAMHAAGLSGAYFHGLRADVLCAVGHWEAACEAYNRIIALHDGIDDRVHGAEDRLRRAVCRAHAGDGEDRDLDLAWVRERLLDLPPVSRVRYQLAVSDLALLAGDGQGALAALEALPEGWRQDPDLAPDVWRARQQAHLLRGEIAEARAADEQARAWAAVKGYGLFQWSGDLEAERDSSTVPAQLARVCVCRQ